ncbi:MAG: aspartate dehydrogenase [Lachnospiraceae bacterium]|nr:aspartate dehydrogenase [Lachnospiraceae bacterium]
MAVIKCSICNGEQVAGFKDKEDGHFTEVMLIREPGDIERFKEIYKIEEIKKEY